MKLIVLALILAVTSAMAQSAAPATTQPKKAEAPVVTLVEKPPVEVARLSPFELRDHLGRYGSIRTFEPMCPVINGYPTFYCCAGTGCICYFMWDLPKGCY